MENKYTCQICEREIKAKNGIIAHHGYQRPDRGSGWQTSSCWGARHEPYEVSCDQMQPYIDSVVSYVENQKLINKGLIENPPETIMENSMYARKEPKIYKRPENFDSKKNVDEDAYNYRGSWSYENEHYSLFRLHKREIDGGNREIKRMETRLANWKKHE